MLLDKKCLSLLLLLSVPLFGMEEERLGEQFFECEAAFSIDREGDLPKVRRDFSPCQDAAELLSNCYEGQEHSDFFDGGRNGRNTEVIIRSRRGRYEGWSQKSYPALRVDPAFAAKIIEAAQSKDYWGY